MMSDYCENYCEKAELKAEMKRLREEIMSFYDLLVKDKERLDFLQEITDGYGKGWMLRRSEDGRGWRLHETDRKEARTSVRDAIDDVRLLFGPEVFRRQDEDKE
jgi:hypothetical protein